MASGFSWPCRGFGLPTFKNSWFFAIFNSPARPSADFGLVDLRKLVVFCDFQISRATLCGLWAGRPSKTRAFLRFSNRPRDPLRTLGWSTFENSWFFCDFQNARATLCGLWAGRPSKTRAFLRSSNRLRDPLRRFARLNGSRRGAARIFLEAVNPEPLPSPGDLLQSALDVSSKRCRAIGIASDTLLKNFSLSAHARAQLFSLNFCYQTFYSKTLPSKLFSRKPEIP